MDIRTFPRNNIERLFREFSDHPQREKKQLMDDTREVQILKLTVDSSCQPLQACSDFQDLGDYGRMLDDIQLITL